MVTGDKYSIQVYINEFGGWHRWVVYLSLPKSDDKFLSYTFVLCAVIVCDPVSFIHITIWCAGVILDTF